jgi:hypothetical protein
MLVLGMNACPGCEYVISPNEVKMVTREAACQFATPIGCTKRQTSFSGVNICPKDPLIIHEVNPC